MGKGVVCRLAAGTVAWTLAGLICLVHVRPAPAQEAGFAGVAVEDRTPIRAGGSSGFYVVGYLNQGDRVRVESIEGGWYRIVPPPGVLAAIAKTSVQAAADLKTGTVTADQTPTYAANAEPTGAEAGQSPHWRRQGSLARGATVHIVRDAGAFYLITPPAGTSVYVSPSGLRRADIPVALPVPAPASPAPPVPAAPSPPLIAAPPPAPTPTPSPATMPITSMAPAAPPPPPPAPEPPAPAAPPPPPRPLTPAPTPAFVAAETQFKQTADLPLEQQPIDDLLAKYQALEARSDLLPSEKHVVAARVQQLTRSAQVLAGLQRIAGVRDDLAAAEKARQDADAQRAAAPARYDLVGRLLVSSVYDGARLPRLYRLVDPATMRTLAYLGPDKVDPRVHLDQVVGILGESRYDPAVRLKVCDVRQIVLLEPATPPAEPGPAPESRAEGSPTTAPDLLK